MLNIGSDQPLPLVPWNEDDPTFHVSELNERDAYVLPQFSVPYVYEAGSDQGCGCGFQFEEPILPDEEEKPRRRTQRELAAYIAEQIRLGKQITMFGCWDGDQVFPALESREVTIRELMGPDFYFVERQPVHVKPEPS